MNKEQYSVFVGEKVVAPDRSFDASPDLAQTEQGHSPEFIQLLLNASIASTATYENDVDLYLKTHYANHSLVFAQTAKEPTSSVSRKHLPWCICATDNDINTADGDSHFSNRTWFVAFRGTKTLEDILTDATVLPVPSTSIARGSVHMGFQQRAKDFDPLMLLPWLNENSKDKVILVGHSLGGAVALLAFLNVLKVESINGLQLLREGRLRCITFGAPLVGDRYFAEDVKNIAGTKGLTDQSIIHVVYEDDIIPKLVSTLSSALLLKKRKVVKLRRSSADVVNDAVKSLSSMLISNAVPAAAIPLAIFDGITAAVKIVSSVVLAYARERVMVGAGAFIKLAVTNTRFDLSWCDSAEAAKLLGPQTYPNSAAIQNAIQSHSIRDHYVRHLEDILQRFELAGKITRRTHAERLVAMEKNAKLMDPKVEADICTVDRSDVVIAVQIAGTNVVWLRNARVEVLMPSEHEYAHVSSSVQQNVLSTGIQYVDISMELRRSLLNNNGDRTFGVILYGYFGHVTWNSQVKICDIPICWGTMQQDEKMTLEDARFAFLQPDSMLDAAILRTSLISRAVGAVPSTKEKLLSSLHLTADEMLQLLSNGQDAELIAWIQRSVELIRGIAKSASPSYLLGNLGLIKDLVFPHDANLSLVTVSDAALALKHTESVVQMLTTFYVNGVFPIEEFGNSYALILDLVSSPLLTDTLLCETLRLHRLGDAQGLSALLGTLNHVFSSRGVTGRNAHSPRFFYPVYHRSINKCASDSNHIHQLVDTAFKDSLTANFVSVPPSILPLRSLSRVPFYSEVKDEINMVVDAYLKSPVHRYNVAAVANYVLIHTGSLIEAISRAVVGNNYELESFLDRILSESNTPMELRLKLLANAWTSSGAFRSYSYVQDGFQAATDWFYRGMQLNNVNYHAEILHKNVLHNVLSNMPDVMRTTTTMSGHPPPGNMFQLECFLEERMRNLLITEMCENFDARNLSQFQSTLLPIKWQQVLADRPDPSGFSDLVRASSLLHRLRVHMTSTYVILVCGLRASGKSSITRHVLGCESKCGATLDDSTLDVQPFYIPVPGDGIVKHLLIIDLPGSNDEVARPSLSQAEGFAVADLVICVGKQDRAGTADKVKLLKGIINNAIGIDAAIYDKSNVCNWAPESVKQLNIPPTKLCEDETRQARKSNCKVVLLMTHADEQLCSLVAQYSFKMSQLSGEILNKTTCNMAKSLASQSWGEFKKELCKAGLTPNQVSDRIAVASCAVVGHNLLYQTSTTSAAMQGETRIILDAQGVRDFLAQFVPLNVGDVIKGRTVPPQLDTSDDFAQYLPA